MGYDSHLWHFDDARFVEEVPPALFAWWREGDEPGAIARVGSLMRGGLPRPRGGAELARDCTRLDALLRARDETIERGAARGLPCDAGLCPSRERCPLHREGHPDRSAFGYVLKEWVMDYASRPLGVGRVERLFVPYLDRAEVASGHPLRTLGARLLRGGNGISYPSMLLGWLAADETRALAEHLDAWGALPPLATHAWTPVWIDTLMHDPGQSERYGQWTLCALRAALHRARDASVGALLTSEEQVSVSHHRFRQVRGVFRAGVAPQLRHARLDWDVPYCAPSVGAVLDLVLGVAPLDDDRVEFARTWIDRAARGAVDADARDALRGELGARSTEALEAAVRARGDVAAVTAWCQVEAARRALTMLAPPHGEQGEGARASWRLLQVARCAQAIAGEAEDAAEERLRVLAAMRR